MRYDDEDQEDFGQNDDDVSAPAFAGQAVPFQPSNPGQPWLNSGTPPWHLWGNTQQITVPIVDPAISQLTTISGQLLKISYKRPETWHWLLSARLINGPDSPGPNGTQLSIWFDVTVGIGRAAIQMAFQVIPQAKAFESFIFAWGPINHAFPRGQQIYTTQVLAPNRVFRSDPPIQNTTGNAVPPNESASVINEIVGQDIQVNCQCFAQGLSSLEPTIGQTVTVEVSAAFAPKNHVRPDWFLNAPDESVFAGGEVGGR